MAKIWEYKLVPLYGDDLSGETEEEVTKGIESRMNTFGQEGWELISSLTENGEIVLFFKRPKAETPPIQQDNYRRFSNGELRPFISERKYNELREDDRFLYNVGPKPERLV